jgi:hypothetical protein
MPRNLSAIKNVLPKSQYNAPSGGGGLPQINRSLSSARENRPSRLDGLPAIPEEPKSARESTKSRLIANPTGYNRQAGYRNRAESNPSARLPPPNGVQKSIP